MLNLTAAGNCGKDAELRQTQSGKSVLGFSIAVNVGFGDKKTTQWVNCSLWGKRGEGLAPFIKKGTQLVVTGEMSMEVYNDKPQLKLNVAELTLMGGKQDQGHQHEPQGSGPARLDDNIPFAPW